MITELDAYQDAVTAGRFGCIVPPWLMGFDKEKDICEWTEKVWNTRAEDMSGLWSAGRDNLLRYMGYYSSGTARASLQVFNGQPVKNPVAPRVGINMIRLLVEQRVTKTNKITPVTQVIPAQDDTEDKSGAKTANKLLESYKYRYNFKALRTRQLRRNFLDGESYVYTNWNKNLGGFKPGAKPKEFRIPDKEGKIVKLEKIECRGDVEVKLLRASDIVFLLGSDIGGTFCYGCIIPVIRPVMEVRADYPEVAKDIKGSKVLRFNYGTLQEDELEDHVAEYHVYIRSMPFAPNGMHWKCTNNVLLPNSEGKQEIEDNPIPWTPSMEVSELGNLPVDRITDVDIEGFFHGASALMDINVLQNQYDKLTSFIMRSIWLFAHPKFIVPRGGVNIEQLSAGGGLVVQSSGPFQPFVATYPVVSQDVLKMWERLPEIAGKLYGIYDHSLGQAPTGTRSASQLMIYDEQEEETRETIKQKLESSAVSIDAKILAIASKEFPKSGGDRVIQVIGENRMWQPMKVDMEDLAKENVVRLKVSSLLPENKYARVRTLVELGGMYPGLFAPEQVLDALEMGQHEKFIDYARLAVMSAESENEMLLKGEDVPEPQMYEDLITKWRIRSKLFQTFAFKKMSTKEQEPILDNMRAIEYLMFQSADLNPAFKQQLLTLQQFPRVFVQEDIGVTAPATGQIGPDVSMMAGGGAPQLSAIAGEQPKQ